MVHAVSISSAFVARGEATPNSNVDFVVELEPGRGLVDLTGLQVDLVELLACLVHVVQMPSVLRGTSAKVAQRIREAVPPLRRDEWDRALLEYIGESIDRIDENTRGRQTRPRPGTMAEDAVLRRPVAWANAAGQPSELLINRHPGIPWREVVRVRDVLADGYIGSIRTSCGKSSRGICHLRGLLSMMS